MIASLKGVVQAVGTDHAVVEVAGVGYLLQMSARALSALAVEQAIFLQVETQVREDSITLYGFGDATERDWFRLLTGVQGVGGRVALAILGTLSADELARAISLDDKAMLARAPGVGPRLAARIATELKGKAPAITAGPAPVASGSAANDAVSALENLGFRPAEAARAVADSIRELGDLAAPALIRAALKRARG